MADSKQPLWRPGREYKERTQLYDFMAFVAERRDTTFDDYWALHRWSVEHSAAFWSDFWDWADIKAEQKTDEYKVEHKGDKHKIEGILHQGEKMPGARWFPQARLNFAENLLRRRDDHPALVFRSEPGMAAACGLPPTAERRVISYAELYVQVAALADALRAAGVEPGDRIVAYMPNIPETLIAMLASTSLGAVWSSCSQDFDVQGVMERFGQIEPKVLFTTDGYFYQGKIHPRVDQVASICTQLPSVQQVVLVPFISEQPDLRCLEQVALLPPTLLWQAFIAEREATTLEFPPLPFDHPLYILFSSGTTGAPKCIVHGAGGTLIQHLKEHRLHTDLRPEDVLFYFTTCGWMMWNWLVSGLASGATLLLYDGCPTAPTAGVLMDIADEEGISVFGTSARYLSALQKAGVQPIRSHRLSALRALLSTGSPLSHESFDYVYRDIKQELMLSSISGGTDIVSCFALGCPLLPVYRGQLQCPGLGMAVAVFDEDGQPVRGQKGELVCTRPFPSMPLYFWGDEDGSKYQAAYFQRFPNVWAQGDYAELTAEGGLIIYGRSDAVLNPGGVRIGTAEIYRQVEAFDSVLESLCIGQPWQGDVRVVLFVRLQPGAVLDAELRRQIADRIRSHTSPRHVPGKIIQVADIPRTLSGKIVELAVRQVVEGKRVPNTEVLANPQALELYRDLPELQS